MRRILLLALFCLCFIRSHAQDNDQLPDMINRSLSEYVGVRENYIAQGIIVAPAQDYSDIYICIDNYPAHFKFSEEIRDLKFKYITLAAPKRKLKKLFKKSQAVVFLSGPVLNGDEIRITLSPRSVRFRNNRLNIAVSDWVDCIWRYAPESGKWYLHETKAGGI